MTDLPRSRNNVIFSTAMLASMLGLFLGLAIFSLYLGPPLFASLQGSQMGMIQVLMSLLVMVASGMGGMLLITFGWAFLMRRFYSRTEVEAALMQSATRVPGHRERLWQWVLDRVYSR